VYRIIVFDVLTTYIAGLGGYYETLDFLPWHFWETSKWHPDPYWWLERGKTVANLITKRQIHSILEW